jgi:long-chain acyl-CoA synthetase
MSCVIVPFLRGATVVIVKNLIPTRIFKAIEKHKVDFIVAVPTVYTWLLKNYENNDFDISSLEYGITGGSYLSERIHKEIKEKMGIELLQGYGLTETMPITCNPRSRNKPDSLGIPGHEVKVKIENGEIFVKGPTIMKGYYNKNGMNREYFKKGWFSTGDYGHIDKDGYIYFDGLKKNIVKVGAKTVDLKEVKGVLTSFQGVKNVNLDVLKDDLWGCRIYAKVKISPKKQITEKTMQYFCREKLANYKIPRKINIIRKC